MIKIAFLDSQVVMIQHAEGHSRQRLVWYNARMIMNNMVNDANNEKYNDYLCVDCVTGAKRNAWFR